VLDSDAYANARADAIGNPPEETHGPETLSHWISQAVASLDLHAARADSTLSHFLLNTQNTTRRLEVLEDFLSWTLQGAARLLNSPPPHTIPPSSPPSSTVFLAARFATLTSASHLLGKSSR